MQWTHEDYILTDDKSRLDLDFACRELQVSYWAANRPRELIAKSIEHSVSFGLFHRGQQAGFARVIGDFATFAYLADVIVAAEHRGRGLGKWMVECILMHPSMQTTTQCLRTRDAHSLYERFGFERTEYMRRTRHDWSKQAPAS
jgi:GNAT superfamily N-acetyltransferase